MIDLSLKGVSKKFGTTVVVKDVNFDVKQGEWFSLLGPSGCGKTTTLRVIAGFERLNSGTVEIKGRDVTSAPPYRRHTGMVFQNYALFPHMTTWQNVAYGLHIRKIGPTDIKQKVNEVLELVQLEGYADRYPTRELSGGQQQRVALARALVIAPDVLLLDEPLSNLDTKLREGLREEMAILQRQLNITTVYVTHDQEEALSMSTRVAVMNQGRLEQIGTPKEIYECPASLFVADFIGKINLIKGFVAGNGLAGTVDVLIKTGSEDVVLHVPSTRSWSKGVEINVSIRPERVELLREARGSDDESIRIRGTVRHVAYYGGEVGYKIAVGLDTTLSVFEKNTGQDPVEAGQEITLRLRIEDCMILE